VRAQLELTLLEDRLVMLHERHETSRSKLNEWLREALAFTSDTGFADTLVSEELADTLPRLALRNPQMYRAKAPQAAAIAVHLREHPAIMSVDRRIDAGMAGVQLAEQKYRPQWQLNASYGYREDDPMGDDRADFFSVGVAFDLPLFTSRRQDKQVQSAVAGAEALRTERALLLRRMVAGFEAQRAKLLRLDQRRELYNTRLLREMREQADASLSAYTANDGDFSEVVRARIAELNARIDALDIDIDRLKTISQLNYFFTPGNSLEGGESS